MDNVRGNFYVTLLYFLVKNKFACSYSPQLKTKIPKYQNGLLIA